MQLASITESSTKDVSQELLEILVFIMNQLFRLWISFALYFFLQGLTIICSKRGGDVFLQSHSSWLQTVPAKPEGILFKFVPITSLLTGIPGSGYLSHAINLYLRCKCFNAQSMDLKLVLRPLFIFQFFLCQKYLRIYVLFFDINFISLHTCNDKQKEDPNG